MAGPRHPRHCEESFKRRIVRLYENGRPAREVKDECDISRSTLHRWVQGILYRNLLPVQFLYGLFQAFKGKGMKICMLLCKPEFFSFPTSDAKLMNPSISQYIMASANDTRMA